ncbi:hypothetical protein EAF04_004126 [Stromatinia cepivora]|nr:hypothetical protein EAF04_004126 [Stromatinia cepivora]
MYFSKAVIAAVMAFTLVQGTPIQPRCDECGGKGKSETEERSVYMGPGASIQPRCDECGGKGNKFKSDERTIYMGPPNDPKKIFIYPSHEACKHGKRLSIIHIPESLLEDRCKPIKEFCNKCPKNESFQLGGPLYGKNPHKMMGEDIVRACGDHCGITYPEDYENIKKVGGAKEAVEKTVEEKTVDEKSVEEEPVKEEPIEEEPVEEESVEEEEPIEEDELIEEDSIEEEELVEEKGLVEEELVEEELVEEELVEEDLVEEELVEEEPVEEEPVEEEPIEEEPVEEKPVEESPVEKTSEQDHGDADISEGEQKGACTSEGMFNCVSGSSFQQCASGSWSAVQDLAPGTVCTSGQTYHLGITKEA